MRTRRRIGRLAAVAGTALVLGAAFAVPMDAQAATATSLSVNLASTARPATGVGEGFLYGVSQDGTQPADQFLQPLGINAFRGGGHVTPAAGSGTGTGTVRAPRPTSTR